MRKTSLKFRLFAVGFISVLTLGSEANAQTLFEKPDTTPDYSRYATAEECLAAIQRLSRQASRNLPYWIDTVAYSKESLLESSPIEASDVGSLCMAKFSPDSIPLSEAKRWAHVYLMANRDEDVDRIYMRKYEGATDSARVEIFMEHINLYRNALPVRVERIKGLGEFALTQIHPDSSLWLIGLYSTLMSIGDRVGDMEYSKEMARELIGVYESIPEEKLKADENGNIMTALAFQANHLISSEELMDSLSVSTEAYRALREAHIAAFIEGKNLVSLGSPLGIQVPPIDADYWFQSVPDSEGTYKRIDSFTAPVTNTPNLLVFLHAGCHEDRISVLQGRDNPGEGNCWATYSMLRRIKNDYPSLQITVVASTHGNIGQAAPLSPAEEADTLASYFLEFHKLPVTLAVIDRPNFRLAGLDRRRIDTPSDNEINYQLGFNASFSNVGSAIILDKDGKVAEVASGMLNRGVELNIRRFLDAVVAQGQNH